MARWILAATLLLSACAARQVATDRAGDLARAAQLTREGCYRCLQDALGIYERRLNGARQPPAALLQPALETSVLLALREKELGIDAGPTFARARSIADRTPASAGHLTPDVLLELAALAPAETSGMDPDVAAARNAREQRERLAALRPELAQVPSEAAPQTAQKRRVGSASLAAA